LPDLARLRHQVKLTFGRCPRQLHHYPACVGWGLRRTRPFSTSAFLKPSSAAVRPPGSARA